MFSFLNLNNAIYINEKESQEANNCDLTKGCLMFRLFSSSSMYLKQSNIFGTFFKISDGILKKSNKVAGIKYPNNNPSLSVVENGVLSGEYSYIYTISDGYIESAPSEISTITVADSSQVKISGFNIADSMAKHIRIYRLSPGSSDFLLVAEISVTQTEYTDNKSDDELGVACDSYDNYPPPSNLKYIIALHDKLFVSSGNKLYFSGTGIPEAFPKEFFLQFDSDITGMAIVNETLIIFTENQIYALYGNDETDFILKVSNAIVGALHNSVQDIGSRAIFVAKDGIYITNGVDAVKVSEKIEPLFPFNPVESAFDGRFYVVSDGTKKIVYDTVMNGFCTADDSNKFIWHSKDFTSKRPIWQLKNLSIVFEGDVDIEVYRDGQPMTKLKGKHDKRKHRLFYVKGLRGNRFSVRFIGDKDAKVYSFALVG